MSSAGAILLLLALAPEQTPFPAGGRVEVNQGPLIAPANIVAMGGAQVSIAEGAGAQQINPAAVANRLPHNGDEWFDWDWAFDYLNVGLTDVDFENNRRAAPGADRFSIVTGALAFDFGRLGVGVAIASQGLDFSLESTRFTAATAALSGGYSFMNGQLVFGAQLIGAFAEVIARPGTPDEAYLMRMSGSGLAFGAIARPIGESYRFGFSLRTEMKLSPDQIAPNTMGIIPPSEMILPWQFAIGMSYTFGCRSPNRTTNFGDEDLPRSPTSTAARSYYQAAYLTAAVDIFMTGKTEAAGFEAWTDGQLQAAGADNSVGIRAGLDSEFWPDRMRGRLGFYYEPSRFEAASGRPHLTAGFDLRLGELIWNWRTGAAIDVSSRYVNVMLSLGFWYGNWPEPPEKEEEES